MSEEGTPTGSVFVCPACGAEYGEPTTCANQHPQTETIEHDAATLAAARSGDENAAAKIAAAASEAGVGTDAGATGGEATAAEPVVETPPAGAPVAAEPVATETAPEPAAADEPPVTGGSPVLDALHAARDAIAEAITHAGGH